jgi:hypothetical protein
MKTPLKLKILVNPIWLYLGLPIYPIKPSAGLFFLIKSRETLPLNTNIHILTNFRQYSAHFWADLHINFLQQLITFT